MKKCIPCILSLAGLAGFLALASNSTQAQTTDPLLTDSIDQSAFPQITAQPVDQTVPVGSIVTLSVQADNADGFQWRINGVPTDGQTNSSLTIPSAGIGDVGFYSCEVFSGSEMVPTRAASVSVETATGATSAAIIVPAAKSTASSALTANATGSGVAPATLPGGGPITVFGAPYAGAGTKNTCPGPYAGYVIYTKPASQGWGWTPISGMAHSAADGSGRTDTKVEYVGSYGDNGCAQSNVIINTTYSPAYRFAIYFPTNVPTTNAYPIILNGFNP